MNKVFLAGALGFGCGALVGSAVTYIFCKREKKKEKKAEKSQQVTTYDPREWIKNAEEVAAEPAQAHIDILPDPAETEYPEEGDESDEYTEIIRENYNLGVKSNEEQEKLRAQHSGPYLIDASDFGEYQGIYEEITLYYYVGDGVLTAEDDEVIVNYTEVIGRALDAFTDDIPALYVRNPGFGADYKIVKVNSAFADTLPED